MRAYAGLARAAARSVLTYRLNFLFGTGALVVHLVAMLALWSALLDAGRSVAGFTLPEMKAYLLIAFGTGFLVSIFGDFRMASRIHSGMVALDLVKPVDYQAARLAESTGGVVAEVGAVAVVWVGVVTFAGPVAAPGWPQGLLFAVSVAAVVPLKFLVVYLSTLLCFWTQNYLGVFWARDVVVSLFSGALVPLALLPGWFQATAAVLPFAGITSVPALIYLGHVRGAAALGLVGLQLAWAVVLWYAARLAWRGAVRKLTVHGG
ncbi:ABC transporter permease [Micromonospora sp. CPCC 206061]|uniref:ABC transporter permease n=1 Tax=Micromonospora sp. CPCC 206061 TaxID=3122410 RepID=UPI002FF3541D